MHVSHFTVIEVAPIIKLFNSTNLDQFFSLCFVVVVERIEIVFKTILSIIIMYLNFSSNVLVIFSLLFPLYNIS